ncbi:MAG: glycosyltransferase family 2 protein [Candidatus Bathyarchaeia archaeon]
MTLPEMTLNVITAVLFLFMAAYMFRHLLFTYTAMFKKPQSFAKSFKRVTGVYTPRVSVLIPAHNEEAVIGNILYRMTELTYPRDKLEVILIDDGSSDATGQIADEYAREYSFIKVVHRSNGGAGKPSALNEGLKFANGEIILTFDADYYPQIDIVEKLVAPFIDPEVGAVQGRVTVLNEEDSLVSKIVTLERIGGYRIDQEARDRLAFIPQYGGTVGGFRKKALMNIGGWDRSMLTEDTDLTIRMILQGYQVRYLNDAEAYEEAVKNLKAYWNQRYRWAKGHMQCAMKHLKNIIKAPYLSKYEKAELSLLLCIYFLPVLVLAAWAIGLSFYLLVKIAPENYFIVLSTFTYSTVGNFAPFFEVGTAAYLDKRSRILWLLPALNIAFIIMAFCCSKALVDLLLTRDGNHKWNRTIHNGNGYNGNGRNGKNNKNGGNGLNGFYINGNGRSSH